MALDRARARAELIRLAKAGPGRVRGPLGRATRRFRGAFSGPLVTVVLPVSDDDTTRIGTCLDSLKVQSYRNLEILVVRFGRHDRVTATVREHGAEDWRIKTRIRVERSLAAARNAGVGAASGELVVVVTHGGDDFVHTGIERLVEAHQRSGSPLVVGALREPDIAGWIPESAYDAAHHTPVRGTTLAATPVAVTDLGLGNKLVTRELWRRTGLRFTDEFPDGADVALDLLAQAPAFDLLTDETYIPTQRRDGVQVGTVPDVLSGLPDWIDRNDHTWHRVEALTERLDSTDLRDRFLWGVLDTAVQPLIADVERADATQWQTLRDHVTMLLEAADRRVWARLAAETRVKLWLLQHDHRKALEDFLGARLFTRGNRPTELRDGKVWALLPHHDDTELGIPPELFEMTEDETRFRATLREVRWSSPTTLALTVFAAIDFVHLAAAPRLDCALVEETTGARVAVEVEQLRDPRANQNARRHQDYSWGALVATVPLPEVVAATAAGGSTGESVWRLQITMDVDGVVRSGPVALWDEQGSAAFIGGPHLAPREIGGRWVEPAPRSQLAGVRVHPAGHVPPASPAPTGLLIDGIAIDGLELTATGRWSGAPPAGAVVELAGEGRGGRRVPGTVTTRGMQDDGRVEIAFRLAEERWGLGERALPIGWYWITVTTPGDVTERARLTGPAVDAVGRFLDPDDQPGPASYALRFVHRAAAAGVELLPPVPTEDRVPYGQTQLQEWYASADIPLEPDAVYFQSYVGASATDSQLALHHELRRTRPELTLYWGVASASSWVPEGAVPVVMTTREWYRVLAAAGQLCMNIDPERWFSKRPGQRLLQTFHGYPSKSMGIRMWDAKHYPPRRIELELDRTSKQWDLILTPEPDMDQYYRREYAYDGAIHSEGYPRDDGLVGEPAAVVRDEVRRRLGIAEHQKAILYAPTWRDDQATNWRAADAVHHLDIAAAARDLGPDYVLLLRGHRFHNPAGDGAGATRFLDVTEYPEINDLILAADAAVLDYSSLRFDFALTRRPIVFLVPDLDTYVGGVRGFLYDYEPTAPGPHVDTAEQVVEALRDIDGLQRRYADAMETFHQRFNRFQDGRAAERVAAAFFTSP